jgi:hypothetical protein
MSENLRTLIPRLVAFLDHERISHEIIVIDGPSTDRTGKTAEVLGGRVLSERRSGYAGAMDCRGSRRLRADARR